MENWVVALAAFLSFAALLAVGVVLIAVDILRAYAEVVETQNGGYSSPSSSLQYVTTATAEVHPSHRRKALGLCAVHSFSGACARGGGCARGHASYGARPWLGGGRARRQCRWATSTLASQLAAAP